MAKKQSKPDMRVIAERQEEEAEVAELVTHMEAEADDEILGGVVTLRWGKAQIAVVKQAASILGVPYQTYMKQIVFRQALQDLEQAKKVLETR